MNERTIKLVPGLPMIAIFAAILPAAIAFSVWSAIDQKHFWPFGLAAVLLGLVWCIGLAGFVIVNPNEARVIQLFGRYV